MHFSSSKPHHEVTQTLLARGASPRIKDRLARLPLHRAAAVGSLPTLKLLLAAKSPVNAADRDGFTALHHAVAEGHGDVAVWLLVAAGAEGDRKNGDGMTALDCAPDSKV